MTAPRPLRVGHSLVPPGVPLAELAARIAAAGWDMAELDVLQHDGRLVVAHDPGDLTREPLVGFSDALEALGAQLDPHVRIDVDVKAIGYESAVAEAIAASGLEQRTLVSTMHVSSLRALRAAAPDLTLGLSVPLARRNYLASPWTRPGAYGMLAYLRAVLPRQIARTLDAGDADAVMAHWGVVTPRLADAVLGRGAELFVWTVDDARRLPRVAVTGIISNRWELFAGEG